MMITKTTFFIFGGLATVRMCKISGQYLQDFRKNIMTHPVETNSNTYNLQLENNRNKKSSSHLFFVLPGHSTIYNILLNTSIFPFFHNGDIRDSEWQEGW